MASLVPVVRFEIESNDDAKIYVTVSWWRMRKDFLDTLCVQTNTAAARWLFFSLFRTERTVLNWKSKDSREWFIKSTAPFGGKVLEGVVVRGVVGNSWEYGNVGGEMKNKRKAIKEHHVNETKERGRRGIDKINWEKETGD
jgi:hypothetical protein